MFDNEPKSNTTAHRTEAQRVQAMDVLYKLLLLLIIIIIHPWLKLAQSICNVQNNFRLLEYVLCVEVETSSTSCHVTGEERLFKSALRPDVKTTPCPDSPPLTLKPTVWTQATVHLSSACTHVGVSGFTRVDSLGELRWEAIRKTLKHRPAAADGVSRRQQRALLGVTRETPLCWLSVFHREAAAALILVFTDCTGTNEPIWPLHRFLSHLRKFTCTTSSVLALWGRVRTVWAPGAAVSYMWLRTLVSVATERLLAPIQRAECC